jgi:hypothetical protein
MHQARVKPPGDSAFDTAEACGILVTGQHAQILEIVHENGELYQVDMDSDLVGERRYPGRQSEGD